MAGGFRRDPRPGSYGLERRPSYGDLDAEIHYFENDRTGFRSRAVRQRERDGRQPEAGKRARW